jgi:DnaJ-class molecular chaperone
LVRAMSKCPQCKGDKTVKCSTCDVKVRVHRDLLFDIGAPECPLCKGIGKIYCPYCGGAGYLCG